MLSGAVLDVTTCRYPSIRLGLKGNRSCYTSAKATATQSITIAC